MSGWKPWALQRGVTGHERPRWHESVSIGVGSSVAKDLSSVPPVMGVPRQ